MTKTRCIILLSCLIGCLVGLAGCAGRGAGSAGDAGSLEATDAYVHKQLERRGL